jgi:two-component system response regulator YesN
LQIAERIRAWVDQHLELTVTIGIGPTASDEAGISRSFADATMAVSRKVTLGVNQIIDAEEVKDKQQAWFADLDRIRAIARKLRLAEPEWRSELKLLFEEMAVQRLSKEDVGRQLHYFMFQLEYEIESAYAEGSQAWLAQAKQTMLEALAQYGSAA